MKGDHSEDLQEEKLTEQVGDFGIPPKPEKNAGAMADISVYGMSLQGSSHIERNQPCQDYSDFRFIPESNLLIAAISDGVGSCSLSHWGSFTAVTSVLDVLEKELGKELKKSKFSELEGKIVGSILRKAFVESKDAVEELADRLGQPVPSFYATLTAAIYDGSMLYYGHIGDDGIVVQLENGTYQMVTTRHKGEEANSVNPLQAGSPDHLWQFGRVVEPVVGFLMSTDGVLDQYVKNKRQNNHIFYPFLENALYCMMDQGEKHKEKIALDACDKMRKDLDRPSYRSAVTDDITVLAAVNTEMLKTAVHPQFSMEEWRREEEEHLQEIKKKLYSDAQGTAAQNRNPSSKEKERHARQKEFQVNQRPDSGPQIMPQGRVQGRPQAKPQSKPQSKTQSGDSTKSGYRTNHNTAGQRRQDQDNSRRGWTGDSADQQESKRTFIGDISKSVEGIIDLIFVGREYEPERCYCPRCREVYEITASRMYQYCPRCGIRTKPCP